jgi:hypothetical protein
MADIFISYHRDDSTRLSNLIDALKALGISVCDQASTMCVAKKLGENLADRIGTEIEHSKLFVVVWSQKSIESNWIAEQVKFADALNKSLVPVSIDRARPPLSYGLKYTINFEEKLGSDAEAVANQLHLRLYKSRSLRKPKLFKGTKIVKGQTKYSSLGGTSKSEMLEGRRRIRNKPIPKTRISATG